MIRILFPYFCCCLSNITKRNVLKKAAKIPHLHSDTRGKINKNSVHSNPRKKNIRIKTLALPQKIPDQTEFTIRQNSSFFLSTLNYLNTVCWLPFPYMLGRLKIHLPTQTHTLTKRQKLKALSLANWMRSPLLLKLTYKYYMCFGDFHHTFRSTVCVYI